MLEKAKYETSLVKNHLFLTSAIEVEEVCRPLRKIGITHVGYYKTYEDGSEINLTNNAEWMEHYYKFKLYETSIFNTKLDYYANGIFIWPTESPLAVYHHARDYFDNDNGVTLIEKSEKSCEFFFFSGSRTSTWLPNVLINNQDILNNFTKYFKEKLKNIIEKAEHSKILVRSNPDMPNAAEKILITPAMNGISELKTFLANTVNQNRIHSVFSEKIVPELTKRENEILRCLLKGQSAKSTAKNLLLSPRTVEKHLENIKQKLNCKTKFELLHKFLNQHQ